MAQVTPNLQLTVWNQTTDPYNSEQLANNFIKIDSHDHSPGKGAPIDGASLKDASITASKLAANSVGTGTIVNGAVQNTDLRSDTGSEAVNTNVIRDNAVTTAKIANANVTSSKLATTITDQLAIDSNTSKKKRYKYISTQDQTGSVTAAWMTNADRIDNLVVANPGNSGFGVIHFAYLAQWRLSVSSGSTGAARLYLVKTDVNPNVEALAYSLDPNTASTSNPGYTAPVRTALPINPSNNVAWRPLHTINGSWTQGDSTSGSGTDKITTGYLGQDSGNGISINGLWGNGSPMLTTLPATWLQTPSNFSNNQIPFVAPPHISLLVPAGTYNIGVKFNKDAGGAGGDLVVRERHIWAWTESFVVES